MAGPYAPRPRPGMTRSNNPYGSLHGHRFQPPEKPRKLSPPIDAPPRASSSDEEPDGQNVLNDESSDDSEFGRTKKKGKLERENRPRTGTESSSANGEDSTKRELSAEPSNIRASTFTSGKWSGSRNGSQSSQKRKSVDVDDDDFPIAFSQSKKPRQSYGSTNKYRSSFTKPGSSKKESRKEGKQAGPAYKDVDVSAIQDRGKDPGALTF